MQSFDHSINLWVYILFSLHPFTTRFLGDMQTQVLHVYLLERVYAIKLAALKTSENYSLTDSLIDQPISDFNKSRSTD